MNYKIVEQVSRKKKSMPGVLCVVMIIFAVLFVVMGITISQAFMLPGFLLAGLYFVFDIFSQKDTASPARCTMYGAPLNLVP